MKQTLTFISVLFSLNLTIAQGNIEKDSAPIVAEGKLLYRSEMASWYGTDLFLEKYKNKEDIGGYLSYSENDSSKCIFFNNDDHPKVIGTISFNDSFDIKTAKVDLLPRNFSKKENDLYQIRKITLNELRTDSLFKFYENTNPNLIPLINGREKKVYVLTGPKQSGVVIFGNDYLVTFDENNKITAKKQLHKNILPIAYGNDEEGRKIEGSMHSHLPETGDFITATDICTLMLYGKIAKWKTHNVVSQKYLNTWNCETETLNVIPLETVKKINEKE